MSSRSLRKLQEQKDDIIEDQDESEEEVRTRGKSTFNAFLLLNESCSESEVKEDDDLESQLQSPAPSAVNVEKKKKRRKKKSGKKLALASSEDNIDKDDIEETVKWVEQNIGQAGGQNDRVEEKTNHSLRKILSIENKHLNPENEMKRIFGSRVVSTEAVRHKKGRGGRVTYQRSALLVTPRPSWPAGARSGLSMRPVESEEPGSWFTFDHSPTYQQVQMRFLSAVESLNPDLIVAILNTAPSHIDSLLQLSEICKMGDDSAMAAEMVERSIYALESGFHPCFNLAAGNCHLDYKRQENRAIFIALFRHLHYVGSRACYRTALEICKVLLNLDPNVDPLAIVLLVDFFAIRSRSYQWLIDFYNAFNPTRNLSQLPNFAFSVALATFHRYQESKAEPQLEEADSLLQEALLSFPSVLLPLLDKCSIEPDPSLQACSFFLDSRSDPAALSALTTLYVTRTFHCWKEPELLPWLERNVLSVVGRVKSGDPRVTQSVADRSSRYQGLPRNIHRHIVISDNNKEVLAHLPADLKDSAVLAWDPLPPVNSINTYLAPDRQPTAIDDPSALRMFFRSLMPNFNPDAPTQAMVEAAGAADGEGGGADLRHSVHNLLDAMRDLLGNLQLPEVEAGDEASDEERDPREWD